VVTIEEYQREDDEMRRACGVYIILGFLLPLLAGCSLYRNAVIWPRERSAEKDFEEKKYHSAITKYEYLSINHPDLKKRQTFLMKKGLSLYLLRSYHEAEKAFRDYIALYPDGVFRAESEAYLTKIEALRSEKERNYVLQREQMKGDVQLLTQMIERDPYNAPVHYDLANKLWELGKYNEAAQHYLKAGEIDAALKESDLLKNRLMINASGEVVPITPERQKDMDREKNPIVVFDVNSYYQRGKPDYLGASKSYQTVAGKVRNQSKNTLHQVSVTVNFYNIQHDLLDTQSYYVGTMGPREVRAFLVKGQNYDNLYNMDHFECVSSYQ